MPIAVRQLTTAPVAVRVRVSRPKWLEFIENKAV